LSITKEQVKQQIQNFPIETVRNILKLDNKGIAKLCAKISIMPKKDINGKTFFTKNDIEKLIRLKKELSQQEIIKRSIETKEIISEENQVLSEGEKQSLIISRALIKKHDLLILDEATSSIDSKNENDIQMVLDILTKNKTKIIIAHKLSTILNADKIVVLKEGKIVEIGDHNNLYKKRGEYYSFLQTL
jgi:ABC-type multidrug transport system fused ATPase/permease subunit